MAGARESVDSLGIAQRLELARAPTDVVCPIHLGLMRGALAAWRAPVTVDQLASFVEPDLCTAHLAAG